MRFDIHAIHLTPLPNLNDDGVGNGAATQANEVFLDFDPVRPGCPAAARAEPEGDRPARAPELPETSMRENNGVNF